MARKYTTEELVEAVKQHASLPGTQADGTDDADLAKYLSEELIAKVAPQIVRLREEFFVVEEHIQLVGGQRRYKIPARAMGGKLRDVMWVDATPTPGERRQVVRTPREQNDIFNQASEDRLRYYLQGGDIVLSGLSPQSSGYLEVSYYFRPGELVFAADYRQVATVTPATKTITVDSTIPAGWGSSSIFDVHAAKPLGEPRVWGASVSSATGTTIIFDDAIDGSAPFGRQAIQVGDFVVLEEQAAIPMGVPRELHPLLIQSAVVRVLSAQGDREAWDLAKRDLDSMWKACGYAIEQRVEGDTKTLRAPRWLWGRGRRRSYGVSD